MGSQYTTADAGSSAKRFPIRRVVLVADRGVAEPDNLAALDAVKLPSGEALNTSLMPYRVYVVAILTRVFVVCRRPMASIDAPDASIDNPGNTDR
ncbi:MAG: hypothetical protein IPM37_24005 [Hahellaceae bacterium]|nr:hypothetical protein [Hahellaceae bacterium]